MKVLIVGKYGFFVSRLIEKYNKEGWEVYLLTGDAHSHSRYAHVFEVYNFKYDTDSIKSIIESASPNLVIFTGAYDETFTKKSTRKESIYYLSGLINILMASQLKEVPLFVYISSHEVFGESYVVNIDETMEMTPITNRGILIAQGEHLVERYGETTKLNTLILRVDHMYGIPKNKEEICEVHTQLCLEAIRDKKVSASAKNIFSSVYISDVIYAIYKISTEKERQHRVYQITSGEEENEIELAKIIQESYKEKIIIKDNTVGVTQRNVMSGKRVEEEFGIKTKFSYKERMEAILEYMNRYQKKFLSSDERTGGLIRKVWKKFRKTFWKLVPFLENGLVFIVVFMVNNRTADSQFFQKIDIFLLYVVLFGMFYGKKQAILSALLSIGGYIFRQQYYRMGLDILIDYNTYVWIAQLFIVGMAVGHLKDSIKVIEDDKNEEIQYLTEQLDDIYDINNSNLKVKNVLEDHIRDYDNSLGMIANIGEKLGKFQRGNIMIQAAETLAELLDTKDVAIYKVSNRDYSRLLISTSEKAKKFGKSLKYSDLKEMDETLQRGEVYVNRTLQENMPIMADGLYEENELKYIIFVWNLSFEKISLHEINLLQVVGYTIQNALQREDMYQEAIREKRYIENTNILNVEEFERMLETEQMARKKAYVEFSVLQIEKQIVKEGETLQGNTERLLSIEHKLLKNLRDTDYVGLGRDGYLYVLLSNSNAKETQVVMQRLHDRGIECRMKEGI